MEFITHLQQRLSAFLREEIEGYEGEINATSLAELEVVVKQMGQEFGKVVIFTGGAGCLRHCSGCAAASNRA